MRLWLIPDDQNKLNNLWLKKPVFSEKNKAAYAAWKNDVWEAIYQAIERSSHLNQEDHERLQEAIETFIQGVNAYSPEKGSFSNYAIRSIKNNIFRLMSNQFVVDRTGGMISSSQVKKIDEERRAFRRSVEGYPPDEQERMLAEFDQKYLPTIVSTETKDGESGEEREICQLADDRAEVDCEQAMRIQEYLLEMATHIISLIQKRKSGEHKTGAKTYYPLWYTEKTVWILQDGFKANCEQEIMLALSENYMDFFLASKCRRISEIRAAKLHYADRIIPGAPHKRLAWNTRIWLPAKVPIQFIKSQDDIKNIDDDEVTRYRKKYTKDLKEIFFGNHK